MHGPMNIKRIMTILCEEEFKEQIKKLVRLLRYTTKNCSQ